MKVNIFAKKILLFQHGKLAKIMVVDIFFG
jgi:hypothetical protein